MNFVKLCILRPVFTTVISLVIVTLGIIFFSKLEVRDTPNVAPSTIVVNAYYPGAEASYMERKVTNPLEKVLKTSKNLENMNSTSEAENTYITLNFKPDTDIEIALNDVRTKVNSINYSFPENMKLPAVYKADRSQQATIWISISSNNYNNIELTKIAANQIKPTLERLKSVGEVQLRGGEYYNLYIEPIDTMLYKHSLCPTEIEQAIISQNNDFPLGEIKTNCKKFSLKINSTLKTKDDFENVFIKKCLDGTPIKIKDIAKVFIGNSEEFTILRTNGKRSIALGIVRQSNANDINLSNSVKEELTKLKKNLPIDLNLNLIYDGSIYIRESIKSVFVAIFEAILLVGLIILLSLGSFKLTLIPLVTIPISLIGTFSIMYFLGFSINFFTLLAMILAIGLVVDDAIVMLENIFRHKNELKKSALKAAEDGANEIKFAIVAMTITLASVFIPVGLLEGSTGKMFTEFAWTLAFCILISGIVALTLTPMMTSRMINIKSEISHNYIKIVDTFFNKLQNLYEKILFNLFRNKLIFFLACLSIIAFTIWVFKKVEKTYMPNEDSGILFLNCTLPEGLNADETEKNIIEIEKYLSKESEITNYMSWIWGDRSVTILPLKFWGTRKKTQNEIRNELNKIFSSIPSASIRVFGPMQGGGKNSGGSIDFNIQSSLEYEELDKIACEFINKLNSSPLFTFTTKSIIG